MIRVLSNTDQPEVSCTGYGKYTSSFILYRSYSSTFITNSLLQLLPWPIYFSNICIVMIIPKAFIKSAVKTITFSVIYCFMLVFLLIVCSGSIVLRNFLLALILFCRKLAHSGQGGPVGQFGIILSVETVSVFGLGLISQKPAIFCSQAKPSASCFLAATRVGVF